MNSMTGFGSAQKNSKKWSFYVQIRTVNSRFLDLKFHTPSHLISIESEFRQLIAKALSRGSVDIVIRGDLIKFGTSKIPKINQGLFTHYQKEITQVGMSLAHQDWLSLPELWKWEQAEGLTPSDRKVLLQTCQQALKICQEERQREGKVLANDLLIVVKSLKEFLAVIKKQHQIQFESAEVPSAFKDRVRQSLEKKGLSLDENRLYEEWCYQKEKAALFEEIERLQMHLAHFSTLIAQKAEPVGKRLDFYTQELLREFNTIGSKTNDAVMTQSVVEAKNLIERLREQVQNVE
jgi:uncharacterized protein (TIGR00255 family)